MKKYSPLFLILAASLILAPAVFSADDAHLQQIENKVATSGSVATGSAQPKVKAVTYTEGALIAVNTSVLFLDTKTGTKTVYTTDSTKFFSLDSSGKKLIGLGDLKLGDNLVILGLNPSEVSGIAKFVVRTSVGVNKSFSLLGKVAEVHDTTLSLADFNGLNPTPISLTLPTNVSFAPESRVKNVASLKKDDKLVVVGTVDAKGTLTAQQISVFK